MILQFQEHRKTNYLLNKLLMTRSEDDVSVPHNFNREHFTITFTYLLAVPLNGIQHLAGLLKLAASRHLIVCNIQIICFISLTFDELTKQLYFFTLLLDWTA